jgi:hypothetical protein
MVMADDIDGTLLVCQGFARDSPIRERVLHYLFGISGRTWYRKRSVTLLAAVTPSLVVRNCC